MKNGNESRRKSFVFRDEWFDMIESLSGNSETSDLVANVLIAITSYGLGRGDGKTGNPVIDAFLKPVFSAIDQDRERYERRCETNRENIKSRWKNIRTYTNEYERIRTDYDNDNDNDSDNDNDNDSECVSDTQRAHAHTPTHTREGHDLKEMFRSQGVTDPAEVKKFLDYYEARGWRTGNGQRIANIDAAVANWCNRMQERRTSADYIADSASRGIEEAEQFVREAKRRRGEEQRRTTADYIADAERWAIERTERLVREAKRRRGEADSQHRECDDDDFLPR